MYWHQTFSLLIAMLLSLGQTTEYRVLISCGDVFVKKENTVKRVVAGDLFTEGQVLELGENGFISLTGHGDKKVELTGRGEYSFEEIHSMFEEAGESLYSRLLASVIKLMTETNEEEVASVGAVMRGNENDYLPRDSSIIMDSLFTLRFFNDFNDTLNVIIRDAYSDRVILKTKTVSDSLLVASDLGNGTFIWQVSDDVSMQRVGFFLIPNVKERDKYQEEYQQLNESMANWPDTLIHSVVQEWALSRKLVWSEK